MAWIWGSSPFDEAVEKATSELNIAGAEDIALNLEICDQIRSKAVVPKEGMRAIKRRLNHQNPNVQLLTLSLIDICIKNGGDHFLVEIASREFMDNLVSLLKQPAINREVKETILRMVQNWATAFEGKPSLSYTGEVYKTLQREGFRFPPKDAIANAMVDTATAPEWIDSDVCLRCRTAFSFTNRKHHCRNCGQVFDQACSSKTATLPHFGIAEPVRVCDSCHVKLKMKTFKPFVIFYGAIRQTFDHLTSRATVDASKLRRSQSQQSTKPPRPKTVREQAEEDLQKAIALSLQESKPDSRAGYVPAGGPKNWSGYSEPPEIARDSRPAAADDEEDDPELRAAIEASLREAHAPKASAPVVDEDQATIQEASHDLQPLESDAIMTFSQTIEEAAARGTRDLVRYPGVGELFERANGLRPKLDMSLEETNGKQQTLSEMHDKLSEAVKLYDRLLTAQISNSSRQYAQYARALPLSYQTTGPPPQPLHQQKFEPQAHASQWSAPAAPQWSAPAQSYGQQQQQPPQQPQRQFSGGYPVSTSSTPLPPQSAVPWHTSQSPSGIPTQQRQYSSYAPPTPEPSASSWTPQPQPQPQDIYPAQPSSPIQQYASNPVVVAAVAYTHSNQPSLPSSYPTHTAPQPQQSYQVGSSQGVAVQAPSSQPTHAYAPAPTAPSFQLPSFPSAPTAAPQPYAYAPSSVEKPQQKEALLISFD
ncbi:Vacuolar protein-sorting-associated protein 27 [Tulasnella sp. 330]|nr:Vacuolar protein-sorting-associated protein 27 [Tulasnella sp. 330]